MKIIKTVSLLFLCLLSYNTLHAQTDLHPINKKLSTCLETDSMQTTMGMIGCIVQARKEWDIELNRYYNLLQKKLSSEEQKKLKLAQRQWLKYRDLEYDFSNTMHYGVQGTLYHILAAQRSKDIVKQRAQELKHYLDTLNNSE